MGTVELDKLLALEEELAEKRQWMKDTVEKGESNVANFYRGSVVFVTGGSGFLGKQLIEKLIRSCNVAKVYILLRSKKGKSINQRFELLLQEEVFDNLRKEQPNFMSKIVSIDGDVGELKIGISNQDWINLTEEVNFIFHAAAITNFDMPLKMATLINVRGTREVLGLAKACKQLKCMAYMSTAFSHATRSRIEGEVLEKFYDSPVPASAMIEFAEAGDQEMLDGFMDIYRKEWPNSYTFTKAVAEEIVRTTSADLPICVVRPAVVVAANCEPGPGWLDINAAFSFTGIVLGTGLGVLHVYYTNLKAHIDFVPVDYVNNATIVSAWETVKRKEAGEKEIKIYTVSAVRNPFEKAEFEDVLKKEGLSGLVSPKAVWYCFGMQVQYKILFTLLMWFLHYIPAALVDVILALKGEKIRLVRVYKKIDTLSEALSFFSMNEWKISDNNTLKLFQELTEVDKEIFHFDVESVIWRKYFLRWLYGARKYIVRDGLKGTTYALKKQFWLGIANYTFMVLYIYAIYKFILFQYWLVCSIINLFV